MRIFDVFQEVREQGSSYVRVVDAEKGKKLKKKEAVGERRQPGRTEVFTRRQSQEFM